jgi:alkanesulfonate monooxygenase SsuD/methylene tetrahydromethanopterin reductase-like flavin-dependent oxidoreductase (luciferase family)
MYRHDEQLRVADNAASRTIATILRHDRKQNSYNLALIRAINDVLLSFLDAGTHEQPVAIPLRILAEYWVAYHRPAVDPRAPISHDLFLRSVWVILSHAATVTRRIQLGTCIVNPHTLHPAEIAMAAATLDDLSGGRFNLGISSGAKRFSPVGRYPRRAAADARRRNGHRLTQTFQR